MAPTSGSTSATSASRRASSTSCRGGCWHDGTRQAPPRRDGTAQRAAGPRADALGGGGAHRRRRGPGGLGQEAAAEGGRRRGRKGVDGVPGGRGVARLGEAMAVIPRVKRGLPEVRLPFQDVSVLAVAA